MSLLDVRYILKGGKGSGHFGHSGRPGKRGGAGPGKLPGGLRYLNDASSIPRGVGYFVTPNNRIVDFSKFEDEDQAFHVGVIENSHRNKNFAKEFRLSEDDQNEIDSDPDSAMSIALERGAIRVANSEGGALNVQTEKVDRKTLRRLQKLYDKRKLDVNIGTENFWEDGFEEFNVGFSFEEFLDAKFITGSGRDKRLKSNIFKE